MAFERGVVVFAQDSRARCMVVPGPLTKVHQVGFISMPAKPGKAETDVLAMSTEDGRIVFYNTSKEDGSSTTNGVQGEAGASIPDAEVIAQLGGKAAGLSGRVKDFEILMLPPSEPGNGSSTAVIVTASSDGASRLWHLLLSDLTTRKPDRGLQVGQLIGTYDTGNRITCLKAFVMLPPVQEEAALSEFEGLSEDEHAEESSSSESEDDE